MPGPTLQQQLEHALEALAEAEREYAAGVSYPGLVAWPEKIARIKAPHRRSPRNDRERIVSFRVAYLLLATNSPISLR